MPAIEVQKPPAAVSAAEEAAQKKSLNPQFDRQLETLLSLYQTVPSNTLDEEVKRTLQQILQSLQGYSISEILAESYGESFKVTKRSLLELKEEGIPEEILKKLESFNQRFSTEETFSVALTNCIGKEDAASHGSSILNHAEGELDEQRKDALEEFQKMGQINQERMESLVALSTEEMQKAIQESLLLFDINPQVPALEISERIGTDDEGKATFSTRTYPVFQKGALNGIEGVQRFLPDSFVKGVPNTELPGLQSFLHSQFANLSNQLGKNPQPSIRALSTIGSLGGIGHKADSDMDAQVIFDTNPVFNERWNDGDFFVAIVRLIFDELRKEVLKLLGEEKQALAKMVEEEMLEKYQEGLTEDERRVISLVLPSIYQRSFENKVWAKFREMESSRQAALLWKRISYVLGQFPYFEKYISQLSKFFSFIKINYDDQKIRNEWFPYSLTVLSKEKAWPWIAEFYRREYLDQADAQMLLRRYAKQQQMEVSEITGKLKQDVFLQHLASINQRNTVIKDFFKTLMARISLDSKHRLADVISFFITRFDRQRKFLTKAFARELDLELKKNFRSQMVKLVDFFCEQEAISLEAQCEFATRQKISFAEQYLTDKYPETEVHFFTNILRNQRQGRHTPFLVSPEGSMAYDLMLNDFLLNPAVILAGTSPIPFKMSHEVKTLCRIGALPEAEWTLKQSRAGKEEKFPIRTLPDWGDLNIPRAIFLEHAFPIFLRESEKISHRNLPKALLNCWWVEMICLEDDDQALTSLTHLLFNPEQRYFIRLGIENKWVTMIKMMEKEFPQLIRDPWWIKFTEMLLRFENEKVGDEETIQDIQKQMIFCFSQHIRLSDVINFSNNGQSIWLEEDAPWRIRALVKFYDYFFKNDRDRSELIKFAQGRDDVAKQIEKKLKIHFLQSLRRVEQKILDLDNRKALQLLMGYVLKIGGDTIGPKAKIIEAFTLEQLQHFHQNVLIVDQNIVQKVKSGQMLSAIEKMQFKKIQEDRIHVDSIVASLVDYYEYLGLTPSPAVIEKHIFNSRIMLAGDPLENVIFQYHFKRNFKRKEHQVPFPISKSLSIPRKKILLNNHKKAKWTFKSVLSRGEMGKVSRYAMGDDNQIEMFEAPLVEGIARCVFSGYLGFTERNQTALEKPPARGQGTAASNPVTHFDLQLLATEMYEFFHPIPVRPRELLENIHYIRDIMAVCNVNRFGTISLVIRDNFGDFFVTNFNLDRIQVRIPPSLLKVDFNLARFFLQFNTRECRRLFKECYESLNIPLNTSYPHHLKIWINTGNFNLLVAPKFHRIYLDGIVSSLWDLKTFGTDSFLKPKKLTHNFDFMGQEAIKKRGSDSISP
ncbi:MAG: hypothetical protein HQM13_06645 [SAR324 cluster bacterium]|nr:hypothetical protein [SAR324 cluster bacterium]